MIWNHGLKSNDFKSVPLFYLCSTSKESPLSYLCMISHNYITMNVRILLVMTILLIPQNKQTKKQLQKAVNIHNYKPL